MTRPARPGTPARAVRILSVLALVIAACGGGDSGNDPDPTTIGDGSTTETTVGEAEPEEPTQPTQGSSEPDLGAAETMAVLTIGGDTYTFAIIDEGFCDPDRFGVGFMAMLDHVDENGEPVEPTDLVTPGISMGLPHEGEEGVIAGNFGGTVWSAGEDQYEASSIDSVMFDGARADGTATFVNDETGEAVEGTFEVTCAEE